MSVFESVTDLSNNVIYVVVHYADIVGRMLKS